MYVLPGRGHTPIGSSNSVDSLNQFYVNKVAKIRESTRGAPSPSFSYFWSATPFHAITSLSTENVLGAICRLLDKCSVAYLIPTCVFKRIAYLIAVCCWTVQSFIIFQQALKSCSLHLYWRQQVLISQIQTPIGSNRTCRSTFKTAWKLSRPLAYALYCDPQRTEYLIAQTNPFASLVIKTLSQCVAG